YKVEESMVPAFSGTRKLLCPLLDPNTTYAAFAANGGGGGPGRKTSTDRTGRGYLMSRWLRFFGLKSGDEKKLLQRWAEAAGPLELTVVAVGRDNHFHGLEE